MNHTKSLHFEGSLQKRANFLTDENIKKITNCHQQLNQDEVIQLVDRYDKKVKYFMFWRKEEKSEDIIYNVILVNRKTGVLITILPVRNMMVASKLKMTKYSSIQAIEQNSFSP